MLSLRLWPELINKYGARRLWSFFVATRDADGWFFNMAYPFGRFDREDPQENKRLKRTETCTDQGQVLVEIMRENTEGLFKCNEWRATLCDTQGARIAVAAGTVYSASAVNRRKANPTELVRSGDELSDMDTMLVKGFVDQHGEAAQHAIEDGDIAFLVVWDRHPDSEKG